MRHVHRPRKRQRKLFELAEQLIITIALDPERRHGAAVAHESEPLAVRDVVDVDLERGDLDALLAELVVPSERDRIAFYAERRGPGGDGYAPRRERRTLHERASAPGRALFRKRQPMDEIQERFVVQLFVFEDRVRGLRSSRADLGAGERIEHRAVACGGEFRDATTLRPRLLHERLRRRGVVGVDPALEQLLQMRVDRWAAERFADELVEAERGQMALVEHER